MNKLKPCPFCGSEATINTIEPHKHYLCNMPDYDGGTFIECNGCTCAISGETETEAIKAWNTRATDHKPTRLEKIQQIGGIRTINEKALAMAREINKINENASEGCLNNRPCVWCIEQYLLQEAEDERI